MKLAIDVDEARLRRLRERLSDEVDKGVIHSTPLAKVPGPPHRGRRPPRPPPADPADALDAGDAAVAAGDAELAVTAVEQCPLERCEILGGVRFGDALLAFSSQMRYKKRKPPCTAPGGAQWRAKWPRSLVQQREVETRLRELQLTSEALRESVRAGDLARADCTDFDPVSTPGYEALEVDGPSASRETQPLFGWFKEDRNNLPLVVAPDRTMAITVDIRGWLDRRP